jgi:hypothetical protein
MLLKCIIYRDENETYEYNLYDMATIKLLYKNVEN